MQQQQDEFTSSPFAGPSRTRPHRTPKAKPKPYDRPSASAQTRTPVDAAAAGATIPSDTTPRTPTQTPGQGSPRLARTGSRLFNTLTRAISRPLSWLASSPTTPTSRSDIESLPLATPDSHQSSTSSSTRRHLPMSASLGAMAASPSQDAPMRPPSSSAISPQLSSAQQRPTDRHTPIATSRRALTIETTPSGPLSEGFGRMDFSARSPSPALSSSASAAIRAYARRPRASAGSYRAASVVSNESSTPASVRDVDYGSGRTTYAYGFGAERRVGGLTAQALAGRSSLGPGPAAPHSPLSASSDRFPSRSPFARAPSRSPLATPSSRQAMTHARHGSPALSRARSLAPSSPAASVAGSASRPRPWSTLYLAPPRSRPSDGEEIMRELAAARRAGMGSPSVSGGDFEDRPGTPLSVKLGKRDAADALGFANLGFEARVSDAGSAAGSALGGSARKRQMVWDPEMGFVSRQELEARQPQQAPPQNEAERILSVLESMRTPLGDARKDQSGGSSSRASTPSRLTQSIPVPLPAPSRLRREAALDEGDGDGNASYPARVTRSAAKRASRASPTRREDGMRAKLKRTAPKPQRAPVTRSRRGFRFEDESSDDADGDDGSVNDSQDGANSESREGRSDEEDSAEEVATPPRRVTRGMMRAKAKGEDALSPPPSTRSAKAKTSKMAAKSPSKASTKAKPTGRITVRTSTRTAAVEAASTRDAASEASKRRTRQSQAKSPSPVEDETMDDDQMRPFESLSSGKAKTVGFADATKQDGSELVAKKSKFQVLSSSGTTADGPRQRSSLRQGIEKTSRTHGKSGKISAWDSDEGEDDEDENADLPDASELEKIKLPANFFPSGFTFGASNPAASASQKASDSNSARQSNATGKPLETTTAGGEGGDAPATSAAPDSGSLLGRLGGFAAASQPAEPSPAPTSKFSFAPTPASSGSVGSTGFSFGAPASQTEKAPEDNEKPKRPAPVASDFFSTPPPANSAATSLKNEKNSGSPPNFFGSANKPAETGVLGKAPAAGSGFAAAPAFTFGGPPSTAPAGATQKSGSEKTEGKAQEKPAQAAMGAEAPAPFSFGAPSSAPAPADKDKPAPASPFGGFKGFGSISSASGSAAEDGNKQKRAAGDEEAEPAAKKSFTFGGGGGFGAPSAGNTSPAATTNGASAPAFSFGAPASGSSATNSTSQTPAPADEKAATPFASSSVSNPAGTTAAPFSFGKPASTPSAASGPAASSTFTFGQSSSSSTPSAPSGGFSFGTPKADADKTPSATPATTSGSASNGFTFGAPKKDDDAKPNGTAASSGGGFTFKPAEQSKPSAGGSGFSFQPAQPPSTASSTGADSGAASKPAFSFGTPQPNPGSNANHDMMDDSPVSQAPFGAGLPASTAGATSSATSGFGSPSPAPTSSSGFSFGMSNNAASSSSTSKPFTFGAPSGGSTAATSAPIPAPFGSSGGGGFGTPAAGQPSTPTTGTGGGGFSFTFGTPSGGANPSSPAPTFGQSQPTQPQTSQPFTFGAPASASSGTSNGSGMFHFGAGNTSAATPSTSSNSFAFGKTSSAPASPAPFAFGAPSAAPSAMPGAGGSAGGFSFAPSPGASPAPAPAPGGISFSIGSGWNAGSGSQPGTPGPGGRQVKGLPGRRRRG